MSHHDTQHKAGQVMIGRLQGHPIEEALLRYEEEAIQAISVAPGEKCFSLFCVAVDDPPEAAEIHLGVEAATAFAQFILKHAKQ